MLAMLGLPDPRERSGGFLPMLRRGGSQIVTILTANEEEEPPRQRKSARTG
jgi:hypothetical protein